MLMRQWSPISPVPTTSLDNNNNNTAPSKQRTFLRWCKLIISALVPITLCSFFVVYILQKESIFNEKHRHEQENELNQQQQIAFDTYINDISTSLLQVPDMNNISETLRLHIRTKTLMILRSLDVKRKQDIILFLYERNLIQNNQVNLYGADLTNVQLTCPHDFHHLYLPGVIWTNAVFINCRLTHAVFSQAYLLNARFINSTLQYATLTEANLDNSEFIQTIIINANFNGTSLLHADFHQAEFVQGNHFRNADLYQAKLTDDQLQGKGVTIIKHDFCHGRFPNGSFEAITADENLLLNGDAEMCRSDEQNPWISLNANMTFVDEVMKNFTNENTTTDNKEWGQCLFIISAKTQVYQVINLRSYSLLIDTNNAAFSFSAFADCNQSYFQIDMHQSDNILHGSKMFSEPSVKMSLFNNISMYQYGDEPMYRLLKHTRNVRISFGVDTSDVAIQCYFDNIIFKIYPSKLK